MSRCSQRRNGALCCFALQSPTLAAALQPRCTPRSANTSHTPCCRRAETRLEARDAAELVADRKPLYLTLTARDKGAHFMLIEMKKE